MQALNGISFMGLLGSSALVVSNDAPTAVKVAARLAKVVFGVRIQICDGTDDHVQIQAALGALPATGGEVKLLDGTYNVEASIVLDRYQTLRGCGRNTILTTTTANLDIITATGSSGSEKVGILLADFCVDGNAGAATNDIGILWTYVDYSTITNVFPVDNGEAGIRLVTSDSNQIIGNTCTGNLYGIYLYTSESNIVNHNVCNTNDDNGIYLDESAHNTVNSNHCRGNLWQGFYTWDADDNVFNGNTVQSSGHEGFCLTGDNNIVSDSSIIENAEHGLDISGDGNIIRGNTVKANGYHGIDVAGIGNSIIGNTCTANNQANAARSNIRLYGADYCLIADNICRQGALTNKPVYGIDISNANCDKNILQGNDLHDAGATANLRDAGTLTTVRDDNQEINIAQVRHYDYVKNTSGGDLAAGDVVVLKAVAAGNEITTTVAQGDDKVFGMVAETIANNASGLVLVKGKTTALKVDGTADIAIGDLLGTFTTAKIAMQAAAGDMAFAMALEAYAADDSNGVINALLISPRKV